MRVWLPLIWPGEGRNRGDLALLRLRGGERCGGLAGVALAQGDYTQDPWEALGGYALHLPSRMLWEHKEVVNPPPPGSSLAGMGIACCPLSHSLLPQRACV